MYSANLGTACFLERIKCLRVEVTYAKVAKPTRKLVYSDLKLCELQKNAES